MPKIDLAYYRARIKWPREEERIYLWWAVSEPRDELKSGARS